MAEDSTPGDGSYPILRASLRDMVTGDGIQFEFLPEEFTEEVQPQWEEVAIIGRSAPHLGYAGTGPRSVNFEVKLVAWNDAKIEVFDKAMWIQSLKYPTYSGSLMLPPHEVRLVVGNFIRLHGIVESASVTWTGPYSLPTHYPMQASLSVSIKEVVKTPYGYERVRGASSVGGRTSAADLGGAQSAFSDLGRILGG